MGKCKFCGMDAGLLRSVHKDCEVRHKDGMIDVCVVLQKAAQGVIDLELADSEARKLADECFVTPTEFSELLFAAYDNAISAFLTTIYYHVTKRRFLQSTSPISSYQWTPYLIALPIQRW